MPAMFLRFTVAKTSTAPLLPRCMGDRGPGLIQCAFRFRKSPPRTGPRIVQPFLHGAAARQADHVASKASTLSPILQRLVETCLDRETAVIRRYSSVLYGPIPPSVIKLSLPIRRLRPDLGTGKRTSSSHKLLQQPQATI